MLSHILDNIIPICKITEKQRYYTSKATVICFYQPHKTILHLSGLIDKLHMFTISIIDNTAIHKQNIRHTKDYHTQYILPLFMNSLLFLQPQCYNIFYRQPHNIACKVVIINE